MARPTFIDAVPITQGTSATPGPVAVPISVPADATGVVLVVSGYQGGLLDISSNFTTGGWTIEQLEPTGDLDHAAVAWAPITATGPGRTYTPILTGDYGAQPGVAMYFYKDVPLAPGAWIVGLRDVRFERGVSYVPLSATVDTDADCDVIVYNGHSSGATPDINSGWTSRAEMSYTDYSFVTGTLDATPGSEVTYDAVVGNYPVLTLVAVRGITSGGEPEKKLKARVGGAWVEGTLKVRVGGTWVEGLPKARVGGAWV